MAIPFLNNINLDDNQLQNAKLHVTSSAPTSAKGQIYLDSSANTLKYHNGSAWIEVTGGTVTNVSSSTTDQLTVSSESTTPSISIVTGVVSDGGTALSTSGQVFSYVAQETDKLDKYNNWNISDGSNSQSILSNNTLTVVGSGPVSAVVSATDTLTIGLDSQTQTNTTNGSESVTYGGSFTVIDSVTRTPKGIVSGVNLKTITLPNSDNTDVDVNTTNLVSRLGGITGDVAIGGTSSEVTILGSLTVTGTVKTNNVETVSTSNGVVFEGNTADEHEGTLVAGTLTGDRTYTLPDDTGVIALLSDLPASVSSTQYKATIADSVSGTDFQHGLGEDVVVQLFDNATKETVFADIVRSGNYLNITFASTPVNSIRVLVQKIG